MWVCCKSGLGLTLYADDLLVFIFVLICPNLRPLYVCLLAGSNVIKGVVEVGKLLRHALARCFDNSLIRTIKGHVGRGEIGRGEEVLTSLSS